jgi:hypothetical protein
MFWEEGTSKTYFEKPFIAFLIFQGIVFICVMSFKKKTF